MLLSALSPQHQYLDVCPSTRRRTRRCTVDRLTGHSKAGVAEILEEDLGDRISCTKRSDTSVGAVPLVYPASAQHDEVRLQVSRFILLRRVEKYLIYHIDKALSIVPVKALDHLDFVTVRKDVCDQRDLAV